MLFWLIACEFQPNPSQSVWHHPRALSWRKTFHSIFWSCKPDTEEWRERSHWKLVGWNKDHNIAELRVHAAEVRVSVETAYRDVTVYRTWLSYRELHVFLWDSACIVRAVICDLRLQTCHPAKRLSLSFVRFWLGPVLASSLWASISPNCLMSQSLLLSFRTSVRLPCSDRRWLDATQNECLLRQRQLEVNGLNLSLTDSSPAANIAQRWCES